jgi:RTX calcium-binding nonapeptide repeat (4 copies)
MINGLAYIASYGDLIKAFGLNATAGLNHYQNSGIKEGRTVSFDALKYTASYGDLIKAFGTNTQAATEHYILAGYNEGRRASFDALKYIASYGDLMNAFGTNTQTATSHYISNGFTEGRKATFDAQWYLAKYGDIRNAFGNNETTATTHYISNGRKDGHNYNTAGNDTLKGSALADNLNGYAGNDTLIGGAGKDVLTGGTGADVFKFNATTDSAVGASADTIKDFSQLDLDKIDFSAIDADTSLAGDQAFNYINSSAFTNIAGELRIDAATNTVYGDINGDGVADFQIAVLGVVTTLSSQDFTL